MLAACATLKAQPGEVESGRVPRHVVRVNQIKCLQELPANSTMVPRSAIGVGEPIAGLGVPGCSERVELGGGHELAVPLERGPEALPSERAAQLQMGHDVGRGGEGVSGSGKEGGRPCEPGQDGGGRMRCAARPFAVSLGAEKTLHGLGLWRNAP